MQNQNIHLSSFNRCYPYIDSFQRIRRTEGNECKWARLICKPVQSIGDNQSIEHLYAAAINLKTGEVFLDCTKKKIYAKCCVFSLIYPLFGLIKTTYHLCLPLSIYCTVSKIVTANRCLPLPLSLWSLKKKMIVEIGKNVIDSVRTPLYVIAIEIVLLAGLIIGPLMPKKLYDIRDLVGKIERSLNWQQEEEWNLARCFSPVFYLNSESTIERIDRFGSRAVGWKQKYKALFNDCYVLHPHDKPYQSRSYE